MMSKGEEPAGVQISRRAVLEGTGALMVSFALSGAAAARGGTQARPAEAGFAISRSLERSPFLDSWLRIDPDGSVTAYTGKAELGQGIRTALVQIVAEELDLAPGMIQLVTADTEQTPNEAYTAGSHSIQDSGGALRNAAAQAREILLDEAARQMKLPVELLSVLDGEVRGPGGLRRSYGELISVTLLHVRVRPGVPLKRPVEFRWMGLSYPRTDLPTKVTGGSAYVQDLRLAGMLHARIVRGPSHGAVLTALDPGPAERVPGVVKVVRDGNFLAVVAEREYEAIKAMRLLAAGARWEEKSTLPDETELESTLLAMAARDRVILDAPTPPADASAGYASQVSPEGAQIGRTRSKSARSAITLQASYTRPYLAHGSIGPSCAVARYEAGKLTIWSHTQGVYPDRQAIAEMLSLPPDKVHCIQVPGSGCYGHNGADDAAADAALIATKLPGHPIRVQWMREQEFAWEPYGPAMVVKIRATLDGSGRIVGWDHEVWSNVHTTRPGPAGALLAARQLATPFPTPEPRPLPMPEGDGDRNAIPLYSLPHARVTYHFIPRMPLRVSALRSLGAHLNVFAIESFMDELAKAAEEDPIIFRLRHLNDPRARDLINALAVQFDWAHRPSGEGRGCGLGFARYKNLAAYCAVAVQLHEDRDSGRIHIERIVAAVDAGQSVNPDGIRNQIEGGILQSMSWTLYESVAFGDTRIRSIDWARYPILRFASVPDSLVVHVMERPGEPFLGCGEAAQGPASAAIANAIADALGQRLRKMPLNPARVKSALGA
jgi:nicotinate dehydrogenase subunit B